MVCGPEAAGEKMEEFIVCNDCVNPNYYSSDSRCVIKEVIEEDIAAIRGEGE